MIKNPVPQALPAAEHPLGLIVPASLQRWNFLNIRSLLRFDRLCKNAFSCNSQWPLQSVTDPASWLFLNKAQVGLPVSSPGPETRGDACKAALTYGDLPWPCWDNCRQQREEPVAIQGYFEWVLFIFASFFFLQRVKLRGTEKDGKWWNCCWSQPILGFRRNSNIFAAVILAACDSRIKKNNQNNHVFKCDLK